MLGVLSLTYSGKISNPFSYSTGFSSSLPPPTPRVSPGDLLPSLSHYPRRNPLYSNAEINPPSVLHPSLSRGFNPLIRSTYPSSGYAGSYYSIPASRSPPPSTFYSPLLSLSHPSRGYPSHISRPSLGTLYGSSSDIQLSSSSVNPSLNLGYSNVNPFSPLTDVTPSKRSLPSRSNLSPLYPMLTYRVPLTSPSRLSPTNLSPYSLDLLAGNNSVLSTGISSQFRPAFSRFSQSERSTLPTELALPPIPSPLEASSFSPALHSSVSQGKPFRPSPDISSNSFTPFLEESSGLSPALSSRLSPLDSPEPRELAAPSAGGVVNQRDVEQAVREAREIRRTVATSFSGQVSPGSEYMSVIRVYYICPISSF